MRNLNTVKSTIKKGSLIALATIITGCSSWDFYAVESKFSMSEHNIQPAEIIKTDAYDKSKSNIKRIAVRAPDGCANETASQSKGEAKSRQGVLLKSNCGHEMAILERSLAKARYTVISWKVLESRAKSSNKPALDIAKEMKADVLLQINSMERLTTGSGADLRWERRFYKSDKQWNIKKPIKVNSQVKKQIVTNAQKIEGLSHLGKTSVNLNVTAADVNSGEAIWFYEWTLADKAESDSLKTTSFSACKNDVCKPWMPRVKTNKTEELSSGTSQAETRSAFEDKQRAKHNQLIKELVADMIQNFKNG